ncbi:hypothetical protein ACWF94_20890 [Streptomyces sp. NPDC055078]
MNGTTHTSRGRVLSAIGLAGAAVVGLTACEPTGGGLNASAVSLTTDRTATGALERLGFVVSWFTCTAVLGDGTRAPASAAPVAPAFATVDCEGETGGGGEITLKGKVTEERSGSCVRGDLVARVEGKVVFTATFLGDCETGSGRPSRSGPPGGGARPTVTVTVTETVTADPK